jgi:integrase
LAVFRSPSGYGGREKRVHTHGLRHTHASEPRFEGIDLGVISNRLGHASIATTAQAALR